MKYCPDSEFVFVYHANPGLVNMVEDPSITFEAKGFLAFLFYHGHMHPRWIAQGEIAKGAMRNARPNIAINQLERAGYAVHSFEGVTGSRWTFYNVPRSKSERSKVTARKISKRDK